MLDKENLSIMIGELSEAHIIDMENHIGNYISKQCSLAPDISKAIKGTGWALNIIDKIIGKTEVCC